MTGARRGGTIGRMEAVADWEFAPLRIPAGTSRSAAATMLSLQAETGGWELARLQLHADGTRKVILRRRTRLSYLPGPGTQATRPRRGRDGTVGPGSGHRRARTLPRMTTSVGAASAPAVSTTATAGLRAAMR